MGPRGPDKALCYTPRAAGAPPAALGVHGSPMQASMQLAWTLLVSHFISVICPLSIPIFDPDSDRLKTGIETVDGKKNPFC